MRRQWSKEEEEFLKENYGKMTYGEMEVVLDRTHKSIRSKIVALGLSGENKNHTFAVNVNMDFFEMWSSELAYVVGFFLADGYLSNFTVSRRYAVDFSCCDKDVIEKVANVCGYKGTMFEREYNKKDHKIFYTCIFTGRLIWTWFKNLGFDNRKSYTAEIPQQVPKNLMPHFIRGVFDGDGSIFLTNTFYPRVNILGTRKVVEAISKILKNYNIYHKVVGKNVWRIDYNGENAVSFLNEIYKDSTIHMDRKYKRYLKSLEWENKCRRWTNSELNFVKDNYKNMCTKDMANYLNRSSGTIRTKAFELHIRKRCCNG